MGARENARRFSRPKRKGSNGLVAGRAVETIEGQGTPSVAPFRSRDRSRLGASTPDAGEGRRARCCGSDGLLAARSGRSGARRIELPLTAKGTTFHRPADARPFSGLPSSPDDPRRSMLWTVGHPTAGLTNARLYWAT